MMPSFPVEQLLTKIVRGLCCFRNSDVADIQISLNLSYFEVGLEYDLDNGIRPEICEVAKIELKDIQSKQETTINGTRIIE